MGTDDDIDAPHHGRRRLLCALMLFGLVMTWSWSLLVGNFAGPDEMLHVDLVHEMSHQHRYPLGELHKVDLRVANLRRIAFHGQDGGAHAETEGLRPRDQRAAFNDFPYRRGGHNQLIQHPPLGWSPAVVASLIIKPISDPATWPYDRYMLFLRLVGALPLGAVAPLVYCTARRLRIDHGAAVCAALLPFAIPQFAYVGGVVNNDAMLIATGAAIAYYLARVVTGDLTARTALGLGLTSGVALLTKAWALLIGAVAALLIATLWVRWRERRQDLARLAVRASAVAALVGAWWWVRNVVVSGTIQPHRSILTDPSDDFTPQPIVRWTLRASGWLVHRFWGWFGPFAYNVRVPAWLAVVATLLAAAAVVNGVRVGEGQGLRWFATTAITLFVINAVEVLREARGLHVDHGLNAGVQGRYLFVGVPMMAVVCGVGLHAMFRAHARWAPSATVAIVLAMQAFGWYSVAAFSWGDADASLWQRFAVFRAWSALYPWQLVVVLLGMFAIVAWTVYELRPAVNVGGSSDAPCSASIGSCTSP